MTEYISKTKARRAALAPCEQHWIENGQAPVCDGCWLYGVAQAIDSIPAADVRPVVRGRWEKGTGENGVTTSLFCSVCHYENRHWHEWNYCPNCGADMREEQT